MSVCRRCQNSFGFIKSLLLFDGQTGRCSNCDKEVTIALNVFRRHFARFCNEQVLSEKELNFLRVFVSQERVFWNDATSYVRRDALAYLIALLDTAQHKGEFTEQQEQFFNSVAYHFQLSPNDMQPLFSRLNYIKGIIEIRSGNLPKIRPTIHLESDETCHLEMRAAYRKVNSRSVRLIDGRFVATNKKLHFLSNAGGWTIQWKNIMRIQRATQSINLELSTKTGNGQYDLEDALKAEAVFDVLARIAKRQIVGSNGNGETRHIPQDVKVAVWQRDGGRCVQCGSDSYLEYDHIIPYSKGGASTVANLQLLCRNCNLQKRDRI